MASIQMGTGSNNLNQINQTGPGFFDNLFDFQSQNYMNTGMSFGQTASLASGIFNFGAAMSQASTMQDIADQQYQINLADIERSKNDLASKRLASFRAMQTSVGQNQASYGYGMAGSKSAARIVAATSAARDVRDYQGRASDAAAIARARNNAAMAKYNAYADAASTQMSGVGSLIGSFASAFA